MHAQSGVFTETRSPRPASFSEIVRALMKLLERASEPWPMSEPLLRFDLPSSEAPKLLRLLSSEQVDAARLFPGRDGVVQAMKDRSLWDHA